MSAASFFLGFEMIPIFFVIIPTDSISFRQACQYEYKYEYKFDKSVCFEIVSFMQAIHNTIVYKFIFTSMISY